MSIVSYTVRDPLNRSARCALPRSSSPSSGALALAGAGVWLTTAGSAATHGHDPGRRGGELLGQHRRPARRRPRPRDEHHHEPGDRPARLRADRRGRARDRRGAARDRERDRLRPVGGQAARRQPGERPRRARRRRPRSGSSAGGNPHRWYSPADVQTVIDEIVRRLHAARPRGRRLLRRAAGDASRPTGSPRYKQLIADDPGASTAACRSAPRRASSRRSAQALGLRLLTPAVVPEGDQRGHRADRADKTTVDRQIARRQIKVWVFNSQNSTPDVQRLTDAARKQGIPVTTVTETLTPAGATLPGLAVARSSQALAAALREGDRAGERAPTPDVASRSSDADACGSAAGRSGATCRSDGRPRASSSRCSGRTARASRRCSRRSSACSRSPRGGIGARAPAGRGQHEIGYLPQRRELRRRRRASAGVDIVRLGLDGARWGIPLPLPAGAAAREAAHAGRRGDRARRRERLRAPADRASSPAASSSGC